MNVFPKPLTGRHVLFFLMGFFGLMLTADVALIYWGLSTHPGEVSENAYQEGLAYNEEIAAARAQAALGWRMDVRTETAAIAGEGVMVDLSVDLTDRDGAALDDAVVQARFIRPVDDGMDRELTLGPRGEGRHGARVALPARGLWRLELTATRGNDRLKRVEEIVVR